MACARSEESPENSLQMNIFDCSICLQMFTRPKVLQCGHTFCKSCLVTYVKGGRSFNCPTCNRKVNLKKDGSAGVDGLTDNISLANLRDDFAALKVERQGRAPRGAEGNPSLSDDYVCEKHHGEALKFYCPVCEDAICEECMLSDHNTHGVMRLSKALEEQTGRARQAIEKGNGLVVNVRGKIATLEEERGRLAGEQNVQLQAIDEIVPKLKREMRQAIEQRASEVKEELKSMVQAEDTVLTNQTEELETLLAKFLNGVDEVERCIGTGATIPLIRGRKVLHEIIQTLASSAELSRCGTVVFTPAATGMTSIPFGTVERVDQRPGPTTPSSSPPQSAANRRRYSFLLDDGSDSDLPYCSDSATDDESDILSVPSPTYAARSGLPRSNGMNGLRMNNPATVNRQATSYPPPLQSCLNQSPWLTASKTSSAPSSTRQVPYNAATTIPPATQTSQGMRSPLQLYPYSGAGYPRQMASATDPCRPYPSPYLYSPYPHNYTPSQLLYGQPGPNQMPYQPPATPRGFHAPAAPHTQDTNAQLPKKRERKIIKVTDCSGRDVTEELLSGNSGTSSPTLPKSTNN
ncbi:uncharacterized protein LOC144884137 [Branchiostoma floridae x Branchiostoma japonicum]